MIFFWWGVKPPTKIPRENILILKEKKIEIFSILDKKKFQIFFFFKSVQIYMKDAECAEYTLYWCLISPEGAPYIGDPSVQ